MKRFFVVMFLFVPSLFANGECLSLCAPCADKADDAMCMRVDSLCGCKALLDSAVSAESAADLKSLESAKLAEAFLDSCADALCAFRIDFNGDTVKALQRMRVTMPKNRAKFFNGDSIAATDSTEVPLLTLSPECQNFCSFCPDGAADSNCARIDGVCGCTAFAEQEARLKDKALNDSLAKRGAAVSAADSILALASGGQVSAVFVTLRQTDLMLVDVRTQEVEKPEENVSGAIILLSTDTLSRLGDSLRITPEEKASGKNAGDSAVNLTPERMRTLYFGTSLYAGSFKERRLMGMDGDEPMAITVGLGIYLRAYFYRYGSFSFGLNAVYNYAEYEFSEYVDAGVKYHNVVAEIPLEFRFGFPLGRLTWISPFVSYNMNIRKPVYAWLEWYMYDYSYSYGYWDDSDTRNDAYDPGDWDFMGYLGFGVELTRHFSLEWQILLHSHRTYASYGWRSHEQGSRTWRLKLDFSL